MLENLFLGEEMKDCFVTDVKISGPKIMVFVDSDTHMGFDRCRKISRYLESHFDESKAFGERYTLEVSSPGIGTPLKYKRQYKKNIGRKVEVHLKEKGKKVKGMLKEVNQDNLIVEYEVKEKQGKKNIKKIILHEIEEKDIEKVIVKVSF